MATVATITFSGGGVKNSDIATGAAIAASKVIHQHVITDELAEAATAVAAVTRLLFVATSSGTLQNFEGAIVVQATGADRTVTVDLKKSTGGGAFATVLGTTIDIIDSTTILTPVAAVISDTAVVDGDIFEAVVTVAGSAGAQAKGLVVTLTMDESPI